MKLLLVNCLIICSLMILSSFQVIDLSKVELIEIKKGQKLNEILPINDIIQIKVFNRYGNYKLNAKELREIKSEIGASIFQGGLHIKPSRTTLSIKLKGNKDVGFVYIKNDLINFEDGINLKGEKFSGSFKFKKTINFDNLH